MNSVTFVFGVLSIVAESATAVCPPRWAQRDRACYFLFEKTSSRVQAVDVCASHSATLVSYTDKPEWAYLSKLVQSTVLDEGAWTDLLYTPDKAWNWEHTSQSSYVELNNWLVQGNITSAPPVSSQDGTAVSAALVHLPTGTFLQMARTHDLYRPLCKRDIDSRDLCDVNNGWLKLPTGCYKRFPPDDWSDAIGSCLAEQSQLFPPSSQHELDSAVTWFGLGTGMWVNAVRDDVTGDNFHTNDHTKVTFLPWLRFAPRKSGLPDDRCVYSLELKPTAHTTHTARTFGYNTTLCQQELPFLCVKPEGSCPIGWLQDEDHCFQVHVRDDEKRTWVSAVRHCRLQGARLVGPEIPYSMKRRINGVLKENEIYSVWVGFSGSRDVFHKLDGSELNTAGHPVVRYDTTQTLGGPNLCGVSDFEPTRSEYVAVYCFTPRNFVCSFPLAETLLTPELVVQSCSLGWTLYNDQCYWMSPLELPFDKAVQACSAVHATLATPVNQDTQSLFSAQPFLDVGLGTFWIGVTRSNSQFVLASTGHQLNFSNFQQPYTSDGNSESQTQCVYITTGSDAPFIGAWSADVCSTRRRFVCSRPANHTSETDGRKTKETYWSPLCPVGWIYGENTNYCYGVFPHSKLSWLDAHNKCGEEQGSLLSISSSVEQTEVKDLLSATISWGLETPLWLGAREGWSGSGWAWSDHSPMSYFHWDNAEPQYSSDVGDNCACIPVTGENPLWKARTCGDKLGFICKTDAIQSQVTRSPPTMDKPPCQEKALVSGEHSVQFPSDFAASSYRDEQHRPEHCRLIYSNTASWRPAEDSSGQWLSITFHSPVTISSVTLRGDGQTNSSVTTFQLQYQLDLLSAWNWFTFSDKTRSLSRVLHGLAGPGGQAGVTLPGGVTAQAIKIWPLTWVNGIALQVELTGCVEPGCVGEYSLSDPLIVPGATLTASSSVPQSGGDLLAQHIGVGSNTPAWQPQPDDSQPWIQVVFHRPRIVSGLTLLGDQISGKYVSKFQLQLSPNVKDINTHLMTYTQPYGVNYTFQGPHNSSGIRTVYLGSDILVQVVRIVLVEWPQQGAALKLDIISCRTGCTSQPSLENIYPESLTASSSQSNMSPDRSRLNTRWRSQLADGWSPQQSNMADSSYIQVDLGSIKQVTAVATQGSQAVQAWTQSYFLTFSLDGKTFHRHGENRSLVYQGNSDSVSVVKNELQPPVNARFVQLWPHQFHSSVALRWEVYTCPKHSAAVPIGCYSDDPSDHDLKFVTSRDRYTNTWPEACLAQCYRKNFPYAGLEGGDRCSCGHDYGTYGQTDGCDLPCQEAYVNFTCGGVDKNAVYSTGIGSTSAVCPDGYRPFQESCYSLVSENSTWLQARARCGQYGGHLVTIGHSRENEMVTGLLHGIGSAWIGLNDIGKSLAFLWSDGSQVYYTNWGNHQPTVNPGLEQRSVLISAQDGTWSNVFSEARYPFVCETSPKSSNLSRMAHQNKGCKTGWLGFGKKCYQLNRTRKPWREAKSLCGLEQAALVHVGSLEESNFLSTVLVELTGRYWTDVSAQRFEYRHGGVDNTSMSRAITFTNWAQHKPDMNGGCVSLDTAQHTGEWANQLCNTSNSFICEGARTGVSPTGVSPTGVSPTGVSPTGVSSGPAPNTSMSCPSGWLDSGDGMCYQVNSVVTHLQASWHEASEDCTQKGANLASFHSDAQFSFILDKLRQFGFAAGNFWCGLHNFDTLTGYEWSDQSVMNYVRWHATTKPDGGYCGELRPRTGDMAMLDCLQSRSWICSASRGTKISIPSVHVFPQPEKFGACDPQPRSWRKFKDSCYLFADGTGGSDDTLTWREARASCTTSGAHLVVIDSEEENRFLQGMLTGGGRSKSVWIGLNELDSGLGYSWSDGSALTWKLNWNVNEPNDYGGREDCIEMLARNGRWNDEHCSKRQGYVCEQLAPGVNPPPTPSTPSPGPASNTSSASWGCPKGFGKLHNKCYGVFGAESQSSRRTWSQANAACLKLGMTWGVTNSGLASITSAVENAFVTSLLREYQVSAWLGLHRSAGGEYRWWDNRDVSFQHWNKEQPNMPLGQASCVYMYGPSLVAGKWNDVNCQESAAYVCQVDTDPKFPKEFHLPSTHCSSLVGFELYGDSCLKLATHPASWSEAEAECLSVRSSLVSVMDAYDQAKVFLSAQQLHSELWLGLTDQMTPGRFVWSSGYPVTFTPWAQGQPHPQSCVYMDFQGEFQSAACSQSRPFMCRSDREPPQTQPIPPGGYCQNWTIPGGWINSTETQSTCYYYVPQLLSQAEASTACHNQGATLASCHHQNTQHLGLASSVWIGMKKNLNGGYYWLDDSPVDYINWASNYPNTRDPENICVVMATNGTWYNENCLARLPFLCAAPKVYPVHHVTLPPAKWTPPQFAPPTMEVQEIPSPEADSPASSTTGGQFASRSTVESSITPTSVTSPSQTGESDKQDKTSKSTTRPTNTASHETSNLSPGDTAAIVLGIVVAVLLTVLTVFLLVRNRSTNGSIFRRASPLRRELSRAKNFENSLYEATRKDTLNTRDRVETLTVETLTLADPGTWSRNGLGQSGQCQGQLSRPVFELGYRDLEISTDSCSTEQGYTGTAAGQQENKVMTNGTHNSLGSTDIVMATQITGLPQQNPSTLESQA